MKLSFNDNGLGGMVNEIHNPPSYFSRTTVSINGVSLMSAEFRFLTVSLKPHADDLFFLRGAWGRRVLALYGKGFNYT